MTFNFGQGFGSEKFSVVPETGEITVAGCGAENEIIPGPGLQSCLDYEDRKSFSLTYTGSDGGGQTSTTTLILRVLDRWEKLKEGIPNKDMLCRNDNHPVFALPEYRRELREGDTEFEPGLVVRTTDRDGPLQGGGTVFYSLQSINTDAPVFKVSEAIIRNPD